MNWFFNLCMLVISISVFSIACSISNFLSRVQFHQIRTPHMREPFMKKNEEKELQEFLDRLFGRNDKK